MGAGASATHELLLANDIESAIPHGYLSPRQGAPCGYPATMLPMSRLAKLIHGRGAPCGYPATMLPLSRLAKLVHGRGAPCGYPAVGPIHVYLSFPSRVLRRRGVHPNSYSANYVNCILEINKHGQRSLHRWPVCRCRSISPGHRLLVD